MASNNSVSLTSLDFDTTKNNLKTYLASQTQFADYNFDGSNISLLLDILSYNTYLNAFYLNMSISEMFLDSAQLKSSVVSKAKELNYLPGSAKSSKAILTVAFAQSGLQTFEIPTGTRFTGVNSNGTFSFTTGASTVLNPIGGIFTSNTLEIFEGSYLTDTFVVGDIETTKYILTNDNIDTDSIIVNVIENNGANTTLFSVANTLFGLTGTSNVYFIQATGETKYEIVLGDNVFGRTPLNNSIVSVNYRVSSGSIGNGCGNFNLDDNLGAFNGYGSSIIPTISSNVSFGGAESETINSIKFNAPRHYQTQGNAITTADYISLVKENFPDVKQAHAFGGEDATGQISFGKVFISPVTYSGYSLTNSEKSVIQKFLSDRCTLGITPVVVDPDFLYVIINTKVKFNPNQTPLSSSDIKNTVTTAIQNYNVNSLTNFNTEFQLSRFENLINISDNSISTTQTKIQMKKSVDIELNVASSITVNYHNSITPGSFYSTEFVVGGRKYIFTDYANNNTLSFIQIAGQLPILSNSSTNVYLKDTTSISSPSYSVAGTIDYNNGIVVLNVININDIINETGIDFFSVPVEQDISSKDNDVILIDLKTVNISINSIFD